MRKTFTAVIALVFIGACTTTQQAACQGAETEMGSEDLLSRSLPVDPNVTLGRLPNGFRYVIRANQKPENRAFLRLVVDVGSVQEDEDQQGLAHFVEHMLFNGTKRFPKQEIINFLELNGMRLGADLNAYTSFDETVYMLQVPTDSTHLVEKAFDIMQEWTTSATFEGEEIDKERGVVIEEWRSGRGAGARIRDKQYPILFKGSRYANRLVIGKKAVLDSFTHDLARRFYRNWYRPDLMSIVAVGDFEVEWIEGLIKERFSGIPNVQNARKREYYPIPDNEETLFAIATDPEARRTRVTVAYKQDVKDQSTIEDYRRGLIGALYSRMLNARLSELTKEADPPFLGAGTGQGKWTRTKEVYYLGAIVKEEGFLRGLEALMTEAARVRQHGFTSTELEREKVNMLRWMERAYEERDKLRSSGFASEYIRHLLEDEPIPGITYEYELYQKLLPGIQLEEVNRLVSEWITDRGRVILANGPEKAGFSMPPTERIAATIREVESKEITAYVDAVADVPLVEKPPMAGKVLSEREISEIGTTEWILSNGIRVALKSTDFNNDQILFSAFSPGGHSLVPDKDHIPATTATSVLRESGLGEFSQIELRKKLAGKVAGVSPWIGELREGLTGSCSPKDVETMFQLIYLTFTAPRADSAAFLAYRHRLIGSLRNRDKDPGTVFGDTIRVTMAQNHYRARPWSMALVEELNLARSLEIYRDRYADAGDFTFTIVGNLDLAAVRPLVEIYLGGLPSNGRTETWKNVRPRPPTGNLEKVVRRGIEPKSRVRMVFTGPAEWTRKNQYELGSMRRVLQIKLREVLREDKGGTYGVGVGASISRWPEERFSISVTFGCAPGRVDELSKEVITQIDSMVAFGTTAINVQKVKEMQRRSREVNLKENGYWRGAIEGAYEHGEELLSILEFDKRVEGLTVETVQKTAQKYFTKENLAKFILYPEKSDPTAAGE